MWQAILQRRASQQQAFMKKTTSPQPGDLVFFGAPAYHVGIYVSPGMMIAAPVPGDVVKLQTIWMTGLSSRIVPVTKHINVHTISVEHGLYHSL